MIEWSGYTFGGHPGLVMLSAGLTALLGVAVLVGEEGSRASVFYFVLSCAVAVWLGSYALMYAAPDATHAERWARAGYLGIPLIPATSYMFTIELLGIDDRRIPVVGTLWGIGSLVSVGVIGSGWVVTGMYEHPWGYYPDYDLVGGTLFMVLIAAGMGAVVFEWWRAYRLADSEARKMQARWFLNAFALAPIIFFDFFPSFDIAVYPFGYLIVAVVQGIMALAILRYDLVELTPEFAAEKIIGTMADPVVVCDTHGEIEVTNAAVEEVFGVAGERLEGKTFDELVEGGRAAETLLGDPTGRLRDEEMAFETADGEIVVSLSRNPIEGSNGGTVGAVVIARDISRRRHVEAQLHHDALHDALTDVPNRALFIDRVEQLLRRQDDEEHGEPFSVLFLDIDRFKRVNESLGHETGDELLRRVADRLEQSRGRSDTVARLGGDEFGVVLAGVGNKVQARSMASRIRETLEKAFLPDDEKLYVSVSVGVVINTGQYASATNLLRDADRAMHRAKRDKLNQIAVFEGGVESALGGQAHMESALRHGIEEDELRLNYQPIVDLADGRPRGLEALARWEHAEFGEVPPEEFIPLAEETRLVFDLGRWVLEEACRQMAAWRKQERLPPDCSMNVNVSAPEVSSPDLVPMLQEILEETGLPGHYLQVEITERLLIANPREIEEMFERLAKMNVRICIDDFGTGYSSLSYLRRFQVDSLKIDREFVRDVHHSHEAREIVRAILRLADKLDLQVVAEGIEKRRQAATLRELGIEFGQGYLWGKPAPAEQLEGLIEERPAQEPSVPAETSG